MSLHSHPAAEDPVRVLPQTSWGRSPRCESSLPFRHTQPGPDSTDSISSSLCLALFILPAAALPPLPSPSVLSPSPFSFLWYYQFFSLLSPPCAFISLCFLGSCFFSVFKIDGLSTPFIFPWKSMLFWVLLGSSVFSKNSLSSLQSKDEPMLPAKWIRHRAQQKGSRPESSGLLASDWVWLSPPVCPLGSALALSPFFCYCQNNHFRVFHEPQWDCRQPCPLLGGSHGILKGRAVP